MFVKGEFVVCGNTGTCLIEEVGPARGVPTADQKRQYYKLSPVLSKEILYIPVDTAMHMRPVLTKEQAMTLIEKIPEIKEDCYQSRDQRLLQEHYKECLNKHRCEDLVQLIKSVFQKNREVAANGKNPGKTDVQYLKMAQELLHGELSVSLGIPYEEVAGYIRDRVEQPA